MNFAITISLRFFFKPYDPHSVTTESVIKIESLELNGLLFKIKVWCKNKAD